MMSAYLCKALSDSIYLSKITDISASLSIEASRGTSKAFADILQRARPHKGQIDTASNLRKLLAKSQIMKSHAECEKVQDAYSIRCIPQVHGAVKETIEHCRKILEIEINSATDNPLVFPEINDHIEGGNFHGEPLALASDFLSIAMSELGNISERRIARLVDGSMSGLPRFLTKDGGLNSGLMIAQYTAAALVSENKVLSHPASVDSIPTSANQEDHNSMGSISSRKCLDIVNNVKKIIAIEFLCAFQGISFLRPLKAGIGAEKAYELINKEVSPIEKDIIINEVIFKIEEVIFSESFLSHIEDKSGKLI
jgi:histidine ammonia-lyase